MHANTVNCNAGVPEAMNYGNVALTIYKIGQIAENIDQFTKNGSSFPYTHNTCPIRVGTVSFIRMPQYGTYIYSRVYKISPNLKYDFLK